MMHSFDYEKLGLFYLGSAENTPFLYKSKNLTTHAAIIGMTGSGKTGLGVGLIEEAAIDGIPSIIIDPKGDMGNLLLAFPKLAPKDFEPWIDKSEAERKGMNIQDYASKMSEVWIEGLEKWGQNKERIKKFINSADFNIYTPGSSAGLGISVLGSFSVPDEETLKDSDLLNTMINSTVTGLLDLIGIKSDPLTGREHILISTILMYNYRNKTEINMEDLISQIITPPFKKIGVFPIDTFFPQKKRLELAMKINALIANPSFSSWINGEPLDIQSILYTKEGKPRVSIFSISHLNDNERMFFVTTLLTKILAWMRKQPGSSSLRALLYMDEIYGFFPPSANPPSKKPMMLLLKQARAFGLGVVLSTQNPVDLDYKGLSNIGTWFIGRLQTKQDINRVASGLSSTGDSGSELGSIKKLLPNIEGRHFVVKNIHDDSISVMGTRWVLSYLKGPMTKSDIEKLMNSKKSDFINDNDEENIVNRGISSTNDTDAGNLPPLNRNIPQLFQINHLSDSKPYEAYIGATGKVKFFNAKRGIDFTKEISHIQYIDSDFSGINTEYSEGEWEPSDFNSEMPQNAKFYPLPDKILELKSFRNLERDYANILYRTNKLTLYQCKRLKMESDAEESVDDFKIRVINALNEKREAEEEKITSKYEKKSETIENKIEKLLLRLEKEKADVKAKTTDTLLSTGLTIFGALFGRKKLSASTMSRTAGTLRKDGQIGKERKDVKAIELEIENLKSQADDLALEMQEKIGELKEKYNIEKYPVEPFYIKPRRNDVFDVKVYLVWRNI